MLPDRFMPLAEQNGVILPIGRWVVESACALLGAWASNRLRRNLQLAVNVSGRQFRHDDFGEHVAQCLRTHGVPPGRLRLELREVSVQDQPAQTLARMSSLRAHGVGFSIDDFGISYSSLSHLKRLPLEQIEISQKLTKNLPRDAHDAVIVKTILGIARGLNLSAMAAGVETQAQRECLASLACSLWQGPLFGRAAPLSAFDAQLSAAQAAAQAA